MLYGKHDFSKLDHPKSKIQKDFVICSNLVLERLIFFNFILNKMALNKKYDFYETKFLVFC